MSKSDESKVVRVSVDTLMNILAEINKRLYDADKNGQDYEISYWAAYKDGFLRALGNCEDCWNEEMQDEN